MTTTDISALMEITSRPPIVFTEGQGSWLTDSAGNRYLDFIQGWAVNCLGHSPKPIVDALAKQAARLINCSPAFFNEPMVRLASMIAAASGLEQVFFTKDQVGTPVGWAFEAPRRTAVLLPGLFSTNTCPLYTGGDVAQAEQLYQNTVSWLLDLP